MTPSQAACLTPRIDTCHSTKERTAEYRLAEAVMCSLNPEEYSKGDFSRLEHHLYYCAAGCCASSPWFHKQHDAWSSCSTTTGSIRASNSTNSLWEDPQQAAAPTRRQLGLTGNASCKRQTSREPTISLEHVREAAFIATNFTRKLRDLNQDRLSTYGPGRLRLLAENAASLEAECSLYLSSHTHSLLTDNVELIESEARQILDEARRGLLLYNDHHCSPLHDHLPHQHHYRYLHPYQNQQNDRFSSPRQLKAESE